MEKKEENKILHLMILKKLRKLYFSNFISLILKYKIIDNE